MKKQTSTKRPTRAASSAKGGAAVAASGDDRRQRILDAAVSEFTRRGFEAASTNAIAEAAGVAKGLVFHYFGTKEALFVAVFEHVVVRTMDAMRMDDLGGTTDLFERLWILGGRKFEAFAHDPEGFQFVSLALAEAPQAVRARLQQRQAELGAKHAPRVFEGLDTSRLRPGLTLMQAFETVSLVAEGLEKRIMPMLAAMPDRGLSQLESMKQLTWVHFERLRDGLYARDDGQPGKAPPAG